MQYYYICTQIIINQSGLVSLVPGHNTPDVPRMSVFYRTSVDSKRMRMKKFEAFYTKMHSGGDICIQGAHKAELEM